MGDYVKFDRSFPEHIEKSCYHRREHAAAFSRKRVGLIAAIAFNVYIVYLPQLRNMVTYCTRKTSRRVVVAKH